MASMKIKIQSDGSATGTKVLNSQGQDMGGKITSVQFSHDGGGMPEITIKLNLIEVDVTGEGKIVDLKGKQVKSIIYADGSAEQF